MSNYSEMGDASIAQKVWTCLGAKGQPPCDGPYGVSNGKMLYVKDGVWVAFDPCNSWTDAGPIIEKYKIDIKFGDNTPDVDAWGFVDCRTEWPKRPDSAVEYERYESSGNPLRAAMIVFLMMNEAMNEC